MLHHKALEEESIFLIQTLLGILNFCFGFHFEAVLRHVFRLSLAKRMDKAVLTLKIAQHKLKEELPKFIVLSCNGFGWEAICAIEGLDPSSQPTSHLLWEL